MENYDDTPKGKYLRDFTYNGSDISISEAKETMVRLSTEGGSVDLEKDVVNGIAKVCLNNPRLRNAINGKMMSDLDDIVNELDQWTECKGVLLYGAGGNFCSGGDLNMAKKLNEPKMGYAMSVYMSHVLGRFRKLPAITVAYIDGTGALGGGAELTTACDYRLMCSETADTTAIGFVHVKMGLVPAWGSVGRLMAIVGRQRALDLLLDGRPLRAAEAVIGGLVDGTAATVVDAAKWLCRKTDHDVNVVRAIKRAWLCHDGHGHGQQRSDEIALDEERRIFAPLWGGTANQAALERNVKHNRPTMTTPQ